MIARGTFEKLMILKHSFHPQNIFAHRKPSHRFFPAMGRVNPLPSKQFDNPFFLLSMKPSSRLSRLCYRIFFWWNSLCLLSASFLSAGKGMAADLPDFTDVPIYEIGEVPFQTVWHGREAKFRVRATALGAGTPVAAGYVNPPSGTIFFDSGNFLYQPGTDDKAEFMVTFSAGIGANRLEQIVPIQPIPLLSPEGDLLGVERKGVPDPTDYLVISDLNEAAMTGFNHAPRQLRTVTISGKEVILREGHANRLFESYHGNENIREFHINAEKLIVASPFHLPSSKVVIRARQVEFQDMGGTSYISTEPLPDTNPPGQSVDGAGGLAAGDMEVWAETAVLGQQDGEPIPRFILRGGRGQNGGPGRTGTPGYNAPLVPGQHLSNSTASQRASCTVLLLRKNGGGLFDGPDWRLYFGTNRINGNVVGKGDGDGDWDASGDAISYARGQSSWKPTSGGNAVPAGRSGNGGSGGRLRSNLSSVLESADLLGGSPGVAQSYVGGAAGTPSPARFYRWHNDAGQIIAQVLDEIRTTRGTDAPAKLGSAGAPGSSEAGNAERAWFSAPALRQVVNHAKAAYLEGEREFTHGLVTDYLAVLDEFKAAPEWDSVPADEKRDFQLLTEEMQLLGHRVAAGLDYFGNPPGWVPLLSLEANKLAFEQEIDRAIGILYLEYWLSDVGVGLQNKIGALTDARNNLASESEKLAQDFEVANNLLPQLEGRVQTIEQETARLQGDLKALEGLLLQRAEANLKGPMWKRVARGLATVAKMIPLPVTQAIGKGLDAVANFNPSAPWESIEGIQDAISTYKQGGFDQKAKDLNAEYKKIKFPDLPQSADPDAIEGFIDNLQTASKPIGDKLQEVQRAFEGTQAPRSQIEAELAKLKAESKEFKQLGDRISTLMGEKEGFVQQVSQTIQLLGGLSENLTANLLAMDALNEGYAQAASALDDRALMYLKEIGRRARERLLLYHYYVKKAYEYRLLRPYPGRLDLQNLFDRFRALAEQSIGTYQRLTGEQFRELRGLYDDALGELIKEVVVEYNRNGWPGSFKRYLSLTEEEMVQLNAGHEVVLDLQTLDGVGLFPKSEEEVRIAGINVFRLGLDPVNNPRDNDEISLYITHAGASTVRTTAGGRPRNYRFVHYTEDTEVPVQWGARYFPKLGKLDPIVRAPSAGWLLGILLSVPDAPAAAFFTQLGGLAELRLKRSQTAAPGTTLRLNEVMLEIEYECVQRGNSLRSLKIVTANGLAPYVEISTPDLSGRQDGLGSFERVYANNTPVTVSAPDRIGNLRFAGFVDFSQSDALHLARHSGPIMVQRNSQATGRHTPAVFDGIMHRLTLTLSADRRVEARYVSIEELQLSISGNPGSGFLNVSLDGERYTPFRLETAPRVQGPWFPVLDGTLILPEERTLPISGNEAQFFRLIPQ